MNRRLYCSVVLVLAMACVSCAQTSASVHVSIRQLPIGSELPSGWSQQVVAKLDQTKLRPVVPGSWEGQLVDTDGQSGSLIVHRDLRAVTGYYTFTDPTGDTLVARWDNSNTGSQEKAIWLWDGPSSIAFVLQINPTLLASSGAFVQYCENLIVWDTYPVKLTSLQLYFSAPAGSEQRVIGKGKHAEQELGLFKWWLEGISSQGEAYVVVGASKPFFGNKYAREALVPERFPPLKDRLKSLPRNTLFDEMGKGYRAGRLVTYPSQRDKVLLAELLSRGPVGDPEVYQIVMGTFDPHDNQSGLVVNSRMHSFLSVLEERNELGLYAPALERLCVGAKRDSGLSIYSVGALFGAMAQNRIDFSRAALAFLERDQFAGSSLFYLKRNACDAKTIQALSEIAVRPELEKDKQDALRQMRAGCK
jgi:hypothetical protein